MPGPTVRPAMGLLLSQVSMVPSVPRWYSKHWKAPVGRAVDEAMPWGERSGSVASSDSRLYIRIWLCPPIRRCLLVPRVESGMVINETWLLVRAVEAFTQTRT